MVTARSSFRGHPTARFRALAWLQAELRPEWVTAMVPAGRADGGAAGASRTEAAAKACAEAIERWAFYTTARSARAAEFGFDVACSTSGMAAHPRLDGARERARLEAVERHALASWRAGLLPTRLLAEDDPGSSVREILPGEPRARVVVAWTRLAGGGVALGSAAAPTLGRACWQAAAELARETRRLAAAAASGMQPPQAGPEFTWEELEARVASEPTRPEASWRVRVDGEIDGPWSEHARVWRTVFEPVA